MENKRDYDDLQSDFYEAQTTASCITDLLMCTHGSSMTLDESTVTDAGLACFNQIKVMKDIFEELLELYVKDAPGDGKAEVRNLK